MSVSSSTQYTIKEPKGLSPRIKWLRDYYFTGVNRNWNNEYTCFTTGTPWDSQYEELSYYIVPETYPFLQTFRSSFNQAAYPVKLCDGFWKMSLKERKSWFLKEVMVNYLPQEILPGDLIAGSRFNLQSSLCLNKTESEKRDGLIYGKKGSRAYMKWLHDNGYGNAGATSGHLIPDYQKALNIGFKGIHKEIEQLYNQLSEEDKKGEKGQTLRSMMMAAEIPRELASRYAALCLDLADKETDPKRKKELNTMAANLNRVPWEPAQNFWEAVQSLWITHMLVMSDENYPGPGVSFGRIDQYLFPFYNQSVKEGMEHEFAKEILKCFWIHCNTAYDALIQVGGNQGITAGYGQLITLSGLGKDGKDLTNDLTYTILEVIDEMSPILEPKPNIRLHQNSPNMLLDKIIDMISSSQGAPFLLNFDERSMAGMLRQGRLTNCENLINEDNVHEYAPVGCLENTMVGNDRSGTVDLNLNLLKAVELALMSGKNMHPVKDFMTGKEKKITQDGPTTGNPNQFATFEDFFAAYAKQTQYIIEKIVDVYETSESIRAQFAPTPYLSCLVKGCAEKGLDITEGGAELSFATIEGVTFATTVDSLLAIKYLVYDKKECTMQELIDALKNNWEGFPILQAKAKNRAPKYGRDDDEADAMAQRVMKLWSNLTYQHKTKCTNRQMRPGMLSWNYWISDGFILPASPDGRPKGQFLSNAICPSNGADTKGPTANANSAGNALGGKTDDGNGDYKDYINYLPNGASHTITFNPSLLRDAEHKAKFKAYLRGYAQNGGTALQINMIDPDMLRDAQKNPKNYRHLLVRITGYNAYFTSIGKELQDEIIARESHKQY